jgi:hypothetical protein
LSLNVLKLFRPDKGILENQCHEIPKKLKWEKKPANCESYIVNNQRCTVC